MRFYVFGRHAGISFSPADLRRKRRAGKAAGFVYVIDRGDGVKVGSTINPPDRIRGLQTGSSRRLRYAFVAAMAKDWYQVESEAHKLMNRFHLEGDWFDVAPETAMSAITAAAGRLGIALEPVDAAAAEKMVPRTLETDDEADRREDRNVARIIRMALIGGFGAFFGILAWGYSFPFH